MTKATHNVSHFLVALTEFLPEAVIVDNADMIAGMYLAGESLDDVLRWAINNPTLARIEF